MDRPLTLDELRRSVNDLTAVLIDHRHITDDQWDHAIASLLVAREQHGGRIRQLIHLVLNCGRHNGPATSLPAALSELHCHLAIIDERLTSPARSRRLVARRPTAVASHQMKLFDPT